MADLSRFAEYYKLVDVLVEKASKEELAECARLLALNVAHYQGLHGKVPLSDTLAMVNAAEPNNEQAVLLADGMEILVGVLGSIVSGLGEESTEGEHTQIEAAFLITRIIMNARFRAQIKGTRIELGPQG